MATFLPFGPRDLHFAPRGRAAGPTAFTRAELSQMLSVYSRRVADGEWRDYAIDNREGYAIFSIFRHAHERPLFTIVKQPKEVESAAEYALFAGQQRLDCAPSLSALMTTLESRPRLVQG
jgi:hypothetical protein